MLACAASWMLAAGAATANDAAWWHHQGMRQRLKLTEAQVSAIDRVFAQDLDARRLLHAELERVRRRFARALAQDDTDGATALVPILVDLEARQNKRRTVMLLKMGWLLTPAQRELLRARPGP